MNITFQWWYLVTWIIAGISITVAIFALRRGRYGAVKILKLNGHGSGRAPDWKTRGVIEATLISVGADIFDVRVMLEIDYTREKIFPLTLKIPFQIIGELPNPWKNGVAITFQLNDKEVSDNLRISHGYYCEPSKLPVNKVAIVVYQSGERKVLHISSRRLRKLLKLYDSNCAEALIERNRQQNYRENKQSYEENLA
jgi:hypothetical protein